MNEIANNEIINKIYKNDIHPIIIEKKLDYNNLDDKISTYIQQYLKPKVNILTNNSLLLNGKILEINVVREKIRNKEDMTDIFESLLWTHNTTLSTFYNIINNPEPEPETEPEPKPKPKPKLKFLSNRGVQFRYGVDSQYGDVIIVMKPGFFIGKKGNNGILPFDNNLITDYPIIMNIFNNFHFDPPVGFDKINKNTINEKLLGQAKMFTFRIKNENPTFYNGSECTNESWNNTWCNSQLHIFEDMGFENILKIYFPQWIKETNIINTNINSKYHEFISKIINNEYPILNNKVFYYGPANFNDNYAAFLKRDEKILDFYINLPVFDKVKYNDAITCRKMDYVGNSSSLCISEIAFIDLEKKFMNEIIDWEIKKQISEPENLNIYQIRSNYIELLEKYNYNYSNDNDWIFYTTKGFIKKDQLNPEKIWKLFFNVKREYIIQFFDLLLNILESEKITGKISIREQYLDNLFDPKLLLYFYSDDYPNQDIIKIIKIVVYKILANVSDRLVDTISCDCDINIKIDENKIVCGQSFTKKLNKLMYLGQGGFTESGRNLLVKGKNTPEEKEKALSEHFDGENFYKYIGVPDPFKEENIRDDYYKKYLKYKTKYFNLKNKINI
jgi:hypothetical protein